MKWKKNNPLEIQSANKIRQEILRIEEAKENEGEEDNDNRKNLNLVSITLGESWKR